MKNRFIVIAIFFLLSLSHRLFAQDILISIPEINTCEAAGIDVPVVIGNDVSLRALQFSLTWDAGLLGYVSRTEVTIAGEGNPLYGGDNEDPVDTLSFSWYYSDDAGLSLHAGDTLFYLTFDYTGAAGTTCSVLFGDAPTPRQAFDASLTELNFISTDGSVSYGDDLFELTCPDDISVPTDAGACSALVTWGDPVLSDCNDDGVITTNIDSPHSFNLGTHAVEFYAADPDDHHDTCSFLVTVVDNEPPVIACPGDKNVIVPVGTTEIVVDDIAPVNVSDNCLADTLYYLSGATVASGTGDASGETFNTGETTVTYIARDLPGLTDTCTFTVTVAEASADVLTLNISDEVINCGDDTISVEVQIMENVPLISLQFSLTWDASVIEYIDTADVFFSGNYSFGPAGNIVDTMSFSWFSGTSVPVAAGTSIFKINFHVLSHEGVVIDVIDEPTPRAAYAEGPVELTFMESQGSLTFQDTISPVVVSCPDTVNVFAEDDCLGIATWALPVFSDDCDTALQVAALPDLNPGSSFPVGSHTITYTATDDGGNEVSCAVVIVVEDNSGPVIDCPGDVYAAAPTGTTSTVVNGIAPVSVSDNCSVDTSYSISGATVGSGAGDASGTSFNVGTSAVTYFATDASGNVSGCSFDVTVVNEDVDSVTLSASNVTLDCGTSTMSIAVTISESVILTGLQFSMTWDPSVVEYVDTSDVIFNGNYLFNLIHGSMDTLSFTWFSGGGQYVGAGDAVFVINFNAVGDVNDATVVDFINQPTPIDAYRSGNVELAVSTLSGNVNITDTTPPTVVSCQNDLAVTAGSDCMGIANWTIPTFADDCDTDLEVTVSPDVQPGDSFGLGSHTIVYTATDDAGNSVDCSFEISVTDTEAPVFTCPGDVTVNVPQNFTSGVVNGIAPVGVLDNCTVADTTYSMSGATTGSGSGDASGNTFNVGVTTVTYVIEDASGNSSTCDFTVTVQNDIITEITLNVDDVELDCAADSISFDISIMENAALVGLQFSLIWDPAVIDFVDTSNVVFPGNYQFHYGAGPMDTLSFVWSTGTSFGLTAGQTIFTVNYSVTGGVNDASVLNFINMPTTIKAYAVGPTELTVNLSNGSISIFDDEIPVYDNCPEDQTISADANCQAVATWTPPVFSDNCDDDLSITVTPPGIMPGATFDIGTHDITYTATDDAGNQTVCGFTITVVDDTPPTVSCPGDVDLVIPEGQPSEVVNGIAPTGVADNCSDVTVSYAFTGATTGSGVGDAGGSAFNLGETTVTYYVMDDAGNIDSCAFTVTITPTSSNVTITCPDSGSYATDDDGCTTAVSGLAATVETSSSSVESLVYTLTGATEGTGDGDVSGTIFNLGVTHVTYHVTDNHGNEDECTFDVTVTDETNPVFTSFPDNATISTDIGHCSAGYSWVPATATDNCGSVDLSTDVPFGFEFPLGTTTVTYAADDGHGNSIQQSFTVTVVDNQAPDVASCPGDVTVSAGDDCTAVATWTPPVFSDYCDDNLDVTVLPEVEPGDSFTLGTHVITYTATDDAGNSNTCIFTIEVTDDTPPEIDCVDDITVVLPANSCAAIVNWGEIIATDNCSDVTLTSNYAPNSIFELGTYTVVYTGTDEAGNQDSCSFDVNVILPEVSCPDDIFVNAPASECSAQAIFELPFGPYDCPGINYGSDHVSGEIFPIGETVVHAWLDGDTCSFTVTVSDIDAPVVDCPNAITVTLDGTVISDDSGIITETTTNNCNSVKIDFTLPTVNDGCGGVTTTVTGEGGLTSGSDFTLGTNTVEYTYTDQSGNQSTCAFDVIVVDNLPLTVLASANPICNGDDVQLSVEGTFSGMTYEWSGPNGYSGTEPSPVITNFSEDNVGTYTVVQTSAEGCTRMGTIDLDIYIIKNFHVSSNSPVCEGELLSFETNISNITHHWVGPNGFESFVDNPSIAEATGMNSGWYYDTVTINGCTTQGLDSVFVEVVLTPDAANDEFEAESNETLDNMDILANDTFNAGHEVQVTIISDPAHGDVVVNADGTLSYTPKENFSGTEMFVYQVCYVDCSGLCDEASVVLNVQTGKSKCIVQTLITPNGDDKNDRLIISCLENADPVPNNYIRIFNEWGDEVYYAEPYKNDWKGTYKGEDLPDGTYYFIFKLEGADDEERGVITIFR